MIASGFGKPFILESLSAQAFELLQELKRRARLALAALDEAHGRALGDVAALTHEVTDLRLERGVVGVDVLAPLGVRDVDELDLAGRSEMLRRSRTRSRI